MEQNRLLAAACDATGLINILPLIGLLATFLLWNAKKETSMDVNEAGRESLNFQVTMLLLTAVSSIFWLIGIAFIFYWIIATFTTIMLIVATVFTLMGNNFKYPLSLRLLF
jgi:uncharacterized Tic20 family protein